MKSWIAGLLLLAVAGCRMPSKPIGKKLGIAQPKVVRRARPHQPALVLHGSFADGTPLSLGDLRGHPWVINLWLPG